MYSRSLAANRRHTFGLLGITSAAPRGLAGRFMPFKSRNMDGTTSDRKNSRVATVCISSTTFDTLNASADTRIHFSSTADRVSALRCPISVDTGFSLANEQERVRELLQDCQVVTLRPVDWGLMDAFQHLNNVHMFRFFESARLDFFVALREVAVSLHGEHGRKMADGLVSATGIGPILKSTSCVYKRPVFFPDNLIIGSRITDISRDANSRIDRVTMDHRVVSRRQQAVVAEGDGVLVIFDYKANAKAPLPVELDDALRAFTAACPVPEKRPE